MWVWWTQTSPVGVYLTMHNKTQAASYRQTEENIFQHQVLVSDLDLSSKIGSKNAPY